MWCKRPIIICFTITDLADWAFLKWCEQAFDALLASLDARGAREAALTAILHRLEGSLRRGMRMNSGNGHISLPQSKELVVSQNQVVIRGLAMKGTISSIHIP